MPSTVFGGMWSLQISDRLAILQLLSASYLTPGSRYGASFFTSQDSDRFYLMGGTQTPPPKNLTVAQGVFEMMGDLLTAVTRIDASSPNAMVENL